MKQLRRFAFAMILGIHLAPSQHAVAQNADVADKPAGRAAYPFDENSPGVGPIRTEVAFQNLWRARRAQFAKQKDEVQLALVFFGDSITQGWGDDFPDDFTLKLDFRATPNTDSGVFVRGRQIQCRDYLLAGPHKKLKNYRPQQWNELVITVKDNKARCTCNGELLEAAYELPATGPIGVEGDRGQMEYRHIRIHRD